MKISDLAAESTVTLGTWRRYGIMAPSAPLKWMKTGYKNLFICEQGVGDFQMDRAEPNSDNRSSRVHGSSFFPETNLFQWLNAKGINWFTAQHPNDVPPTYHSAPGFLSCFEEWELKAIVPHEITVKVPNGFKGQNGSIVKCSCLVSIPSLSQLSEAVDRTEGALLPACVGEYANIRTITRSASGSRVYRFGDRASVTMAPNEFCRVVPIIAIDDDAPVELSSYGDLIFELVPPHELIADAESALCSLLS